MFRFANMLILKVTRGCNLNCSYCYVRNKENFKQERLDFDLYTKTIDRIISDKLISDDKNEFSLIFHGGEPLLHTPESLAKMMDYATNKFLDNNLKLKLGMQTNLTLMNEEYAQVLGKYCVSIGASFDGINKGNEGRTKTINQEKYEEKFKLMDKYGLQYGFLLVASDSNIDYIHESVEYLRDVYKINGVKINYAEDVNNVGGEVSGKDFFEKAWKPFIDDYINGENIIEDNLNEIIKRFIIQLLTYSNGFPKSNCGLKICGGGINIIEMNPDGSIYLCGRYSEDYPVAYVMEVLDNDFLALKQYKKYIGFVKEKNKHLIDLKCDTCPADFICDHGCMAFHYSKYEKYGIRKNLVCEIFKPLQRYLTENAFDIFKTYYNLNKDTNGNVFINNGEDPKDIKTNSKILTRISNELNLYVNIADNDKNQIIIGKK